MSTGKNSILAYLVSRKEAKTRHLLLGAATAVGACLGVVAAFGSVSGDRVDSSVRQRNIVESLSLPQTAPVEDPGGLFIREENVRSGDTAYVLLSRLGIENSRVIDAARMDPEARAVFRQLSPGKTITASLNRDGELQSLTFPLSGLGGEALELDNTDSGLRVMRKPLALEKRIAVKFATINYSLFGATDAAGIPDSIAVQLVDIFSGEIDFHRDLRKGDRFSIVYESATHQGKPVDSGRILAAEFINNGQSFEAVWFKGADGRGGYYTPDGKSLRKAFLRSPLEFSRVTSGFTLARYHPVLKKWRAHKGVDYGAPIGTHVKATGDAVVQFAGSRGGYGKVIVLKHAGPYTTVYGHLSGFAKGIHSGKRVAQGDVIGYVGMTGLATGPHLHYEFRINGVFKNPLAVVLPGSPPLSKAQMTEFRSQCAELLARIDAVRDLRLAAAD